MAFLNLADGQRAARKTLITVAEWTPSGGTAVKQLLGVRTEDSSIEYNNDISQTTDILGYNYTDVNKTQPQQDFDPFLVMGGSALAEFLNDLRRRNAVTEYSQFTIYVITAFKGAEGAYEAEKHTDCTIAVNSIGGDVNVNMPISVYFSNKITLGTVDKLDNTFQFTPESVSV